MSNLPSLAAWLRAVWPLWSTWFGSAPQYSNVYTISIWPRLTAAIKAGFWTVVVLRLGVGVEDSSKSILEDADGLGRLRTGTVQSLFVSESGASKVTISLNPFHEALDTNGLGIKKLVKVIINLKKTN